MPYTKAISYSGMSKYRKCPLLWHDAYILGNREPPHPAAERGTKLHAKLEDYFNRKEYPVADKVLAPWEPYMRLLRESFGTVIAEQELAVDSNWNAVPFDSSDAYFRGKTDLTIINNWGVHIKDWKSGKIYPTHKDQGKAYMALNQEPGPISVEFAYLDIPCHTEKWEYTNDDALRHREELTNIIEVIRMDETWDPTPGDECRWCKKSWRNGGDCKAAY